MLKFLSLGLGVGAAIQAFRNFPPDGPLTPDMAYLLFGIGLLSAYYGGKWRGRGRYNLATATASAAARSDAAATASNQVNVAVIVPGQGAGSRGVTVPSESAQWFDGQRAQITSDELDGMTASDLGIEDSYGDLSDVPHRE